MGASRVHTFSVVHGGCICRVHACVAGVALALPCSRRCKLVQTHLQTFCDTQADALMRCNTGLVYVQLIVSMHVLEPHSPAQTQCLAQILPFNRTALTHAHTFGIPYLCLSNKVGQHALLPIAKHVQLLIGLGQLRVNTGKSSICVLDHSLPS